MIHHYTRFWIELQFFEYLWRRYSSNSRKQYCVQQMTHTSRSRSKQNLCNLYFRCLRKKWILLFNFVCSVKQKLKVRGICIDSLNILINYMWRRQEVDKHRYVKFKELMITRYILKLSHDIIFGFILVNISDIKD